MNEHDAIRYRVRLPDGRQFGPAEMQHLEQWAREGRLPTDAVLLREDRGEEQPVSDFPNLNAIVAAPPTVQGEMIRPKRATSALIPTDNPAALGGYYTGIASLICFVGLVAAPIAIVLGILGLRNVRRDPEVKGKAHAIIAIVLGSFTLLVNLAFIIARFMAW